MSGSRSAFQPSFETTTAPFATSLATAIGSTSMGPGGASRAIFEILNLSTEKKREINSLVTVLDVYYKDLHFPDNIPGLGVIPALKAILVGTANTSASAVSAATLAPGFLVTNAAQSTLDVPLAGTAVLKSTDKPHLFFQPQASTLNAKKERDDQENGFFAHCKHLSAELQNIMGKLNANVNERNMGVFHGNVIKSTGGLMSMGTLMTAGPISSGLDTIGSFFRDSTGLVNFSLDESASQGEKNIYHALTKCGSVFLSETKDLRESLHALRQLRAAIANLEQPLEMSQQHVVSSPSLSACTRSVLSMPFVSALESVILSGEALYITSAAFKQRQLALLNSAKQSVSIASSIKTEIKKEEDAAFQNIENPSEGGETHSQNLSVVTDQMDWVLKVINRKLDEINKNQPENDPWVDVNQQRLISASAQSSASVTETLVLIPVLVLDLAGALLSREPSGAILSTQQDKWTGKESDEASESKMNRSAHDLDKVMTKAMQLKEVIDRCVALGVSAPFLLGLSRMLVSVASFPAITALQLSLDILAGMTASRNASANQAEQLTEDTGNSAEDASTLQEGKYGLPFINVSKLIDDYKKISENIKKEVKGIEGNSHQKMASASGNTTAALSSLLTLLPNLFLGTLGALFRELTVISYFLKGDKGTENEWKNVSKSDPEKSGEDSDHLLTAISQLHQWLQQCEDQGVIAPPVLGTSHVATCGAFIVSLNILAGISFALRECRTLRDPKQITALNEQEQKSAKESKVESIDDSHQDTAKSSKTESVSDRMTLVNQLESILNKAVLIDRASVDSSKHDRKDVNWTGETSIHLGKNSTGFLSGVIGIVSLLPFESSLIAEAIGRMTKIVSENSEAVNLGPDRSKTTHSNASVLSNATRLTAAHYENLESSHSGLSLTANVSETTFSRSLIIALCQSGVLTKALKKLSDDVQKEKQNPPFISASSAVSGRIGSDALAKKIKEALNEAAGDDIHRLNADMGEHLSLMTESGIGALLTANSTLIAPLWQTIHHAREASHTNEQQKKDGVCDTTISREVSTFSNRIEAFIWNCIQEAKANEKTPDDKDQYNSTMQTHLYSNASVAFSVKTACFTALLSHEIIGCIDSIGLLDIDKIFATVIGSGTVSLEESNKSFDKTHEDSRLGQSESVTCFISGLRLTLTHLGQSLRDMANQLMHDSREEPDDLLKDHLDMHLTQRAMMKSFSKTLSQCSLSLSIITGLLPMLPLSTLGCVDEMRKMVLSLNSVHQNNSGAAQSMRESECELSVSSGMMMDSVAATILLLVKSLLKALVLGSDSALVLSKIIEIISLNQDPANALTRLVEEPFLPQGRSDGVTQLIKSHISGATMTLSAASLEVVKELKSSDSTKKIEQSLLDRIDQKIDSFGVLKDAEEKEKIGLKKFFELLISAMAVDEKISASFITENNIKDLVERFNRGGIAAAQFHREHFKKLNPLMDREQKFLGCNDALLLIATFIDSAAQSEQKANELIQALKTGLQGKETSGKVAHLWKVVTEKICDNLLQTSRRSSVTSFYAHPFDPKKFMETCQLENGKINELRATVS